MTFKIVTEAEFAAFVDAYPRPLQRDYSRLGDPPCTRYYDPTITDDPVMATIVHGDEPVYRVRVSSERQ